MKGRASKLVLIVGAALALAGCGGNSSSSSSFTIGGTISGLNAGSVVLENGSATVTVTAGTTSWTFATSFASNSSYSVIVLAQPAGELCDVSGGSGTTLPGNVDTVTVECSDYGQWIWEAGSSAIDAAGVYGTQDTSAASSEPGARYAANSWTDAAGNMWLFGGAGYGASGGSGDLNDLWRYSPSTGQWAWISGGDAANAVGIYGTQGTGSASNVPGARYSASSWIDAAGNLWLFGGIGYDAAGDAGNLNDLWRYSPATHQWTWVSGGNAANAAGVYGTLGTAAAGNVPGARYGASSWTDVAGNLWLFGGYGYDSTATVGKLNDLWEYSPTTHQWTWISGGSNNNAPGVYGTKGTAAAGNAPGARQAASSWTDSSGNFWLLGGYGYDSTGDLGYLNDLWRYSPSSKEWAWISGGSTDNASGVYGAAGTDAASNVPGARQAANSWIDSSGNLWLFGGYGYDSTGSLGALDDVWQYSATTKEWTSVSGGNVANSAGVYGTQSTATAGSSPGARQGGSSWIDSSGNLWLFGGAGYGSSGNGSLNDLWRFERPE